MEFNFVLDFSIVAIIEAVILTGGLFKKTNYVAFFATRLPGF